jgi:hypothetical protein
MAERVSASPDVSTKAGLIKYALSQGPVVVVLLWAVLQLQSMLNEKDGRLMDVLQAYQKTQVELVSTLQAIRGELSELRREVRDGSPASVR